MLLQGQIKEAWGGRPIRQTPSGHHCVWASPTQQAGVSHGGCQQAGMEATKLWTCTKPTLPGSTTFSVHHFTEQSHQVVGSWEGVAGEEGYQHGMSHGIPVTSTRSQPRSKHAHPPPETIQLPPPPSSSPPLSPSWPRTPPSGEQRRRQAPALAPRSETQPATGHGQRRGGGGRRHHAQATLHTAHPGTTW